MPYLHQLHLPKPGSAALRRFARTHLGVAISYGAAKLVGLPELYWGVITTLVVVTQPSFNQALTTGRDQIIGAAIGGLASGIGILAILHGAPPLAVFAVELVPFAALAALRPSLRLACVTLVIVVLIPATGGGSPFARPVDRVLEILIGAAAALVAAIVLPNRAVRAAHERTRDIVLALGKLIALTLTQPTNKSEAEQLHRQSASAEQALDEALAEAGREHIIAPIQRAPGNVIDKTAPMLTRLHRDALFLGQAMTGDPGLTQQLTQGGELVRASHAFTEVAQALANVLGSERDFGKKIELARTAFGQLRSDVDAACASMDKNVVLPFVLRLLVQDLGELVTTAEARDEARTQTPAQEGKTPA
jgi:hypothetical protein